MKARLPQTLADPATYAYLRDLNTNLDEEFKKRSTDATPLKQLFLASPDGAIWSLTVSNLGAAVFTKVHS